MKKQQGNASSGGIGFLGLLGLVFITLKIVAVEPIASWSWWWVTAPLWGGAIFTLLVIGLILAFAVWMER